MSLLLLCLYIGTTLLRKLIMHQFVCCVMEVTWKFWCYCSIVSDGSVLLGYEAASVAIQILMSCGNIVPSSLRVLCPKSTGPMKMMALCDLPMLRSNYLVKQYPLPEEWSPQVTCNLKSKSVLYLMFYEISFQARYKKLQFVHHMILSSHRHTWSSSH